MSKPEPRRVVTIALIIILFFVASFVTTCYAYSTGDIQQTRSGKTLVVNATGGGDYTSIQWAVDNASDGDTILVESGVYIEQININKSISLVGSMDECIIDGNRSGTVITISSDGVEITGLTVKGSGGNQWCIELDEVQNCSISGNNITENSMGLGLDGSNNTIQNNVFYRNEMSGITLWGSYNTIINNTCKYCETGIEVSGSNDHITGNTIRFSIWGIRLDYAYNNVITNNHCTNNQDGIYLGLSDENTISNNECNFNTGSGISLEYSRKNKVSGNTCNSNEWYGIYIVDHDDNDNLDSRGSGNKLSGNTCKFNGDANIYYESDDMEAPYNIIVAVVAGLLIISMIIKLVFYLKKRS